jgi:excisionase family DNA binding protein
MKPTDNVPFGVRSIHSELLTRREAAAYLGISEHTLAIWKCSGRYQLPFVKIGRLVKYKKSDLDAFIAHNWRGAS